MAKMDSYQKYLETLPKKRLGSGCLVFDSLGRLLLVKPTYKPAWEIPGGVVEHNESPKQCCLREVKEETGLTLNIGRLLVVDYGSQTGSKTEARMFVFYGGVLTGEQKDAINLKSDELSTYDFFSQDALPEEMTDTLKNRVLAAWRQKSTGSGIYLEDQIIT